MDSLHVRLNFYVDKANQIDQEHLKIWLANIVKSGKYSLARFANFVYSYFNRLSLQKRGL